MTRFAPRRRASSGVFSVFAACVLALGLLMLDAGRAQAQRRAAGPPPWPGSRVVVLLPLKLGANFNADPRTGAALLQPAEERLAGILEASNKFGVIRPFRFNPILVRALSERRITEEQVTALTQTPTLDTARAVLNSLTFDQTPMLLDVSLQEVRVSGTAKQTSVQMQVEGRLYEGNDQVAFRTAVVTSDPSTRGDTNFERALAASDNAFRQLTAQLTAPLEDLSLPDLILPTPGAARPGGNGAPGATPATRPPGTTGATTPPATGVVGGGDVRVPVPTQPLPEGTPRGALPMFPQGTLPLAPGSANPNRFEGVPTAATTGTNTDASPSNVPPATSAPQTSTPPASTPPASTPAADTPAADTPAAGGNAAPATQ